MGPLGTLGRCSGTRVHIRYRTSLPIPAALWIRRHCVDGVRRYHYNWRHPERSCDGDVMDKAEIPYLSATELSRLIEAKEVSPVEATEAYLERIDDLDFKFNAYLTVCRSEAMKAAKEAEQAILQGNYLSPMHGIPVAVKDQLWSKGIRSTGGSRFLADFVPDQDAAAIANLKKAGAILLGKANLTEFAIGPPQRFSTARNPWDLDRHTGASSSGSGVATVAFLCATSLGEDTGGSIRFPAAWCGVVGFKPSWGRVSRHGVMRGTWSLDTVGPMSRTVEDAAITLGAIAGHDPKDPYTWDIPVPDYRRALDANMEGIRIGMVTEQINSEVVTPEVREAVVSAIGLLGNLGASVEEVSLPLSRHDMTIFSTIAGVGPALDHYRWIRDRLQDYGAENRVGLLTGSILPAQAYYKAQKLRTLLRQQVLQSLERYDVLALPSVGEPAQTLEEYARHPGRGLPYLQTSIISLASSPAISIPCGISSEGLPIGGRPGADETVLKVAYAYERNTSWHTLRPPTT